MRVPTETFFALVVLLACNADALAQSKSERGVCQVSTGVHGGQKFASSKCYLDSDPGNFKIRQQIWEKDDPERYRDLARYSGGRYACTLRRGGWKQTQTDAVLIGYAISDCTSTREPPKRRQVSNRICYRCKTFGGLKEIRCGSESDGVNAFNNSYFSCQAFSD